MNLRVWGSEAALVLGCVLAFGCTQTDPMQDDNAALGAGTNGFMPMAGTLGGAGMMAGPAAGTMSTMVGGAGTMALPMGGTNAMPTAGMGDVGTAGTSMPAGGTGGDTMTAGMGEAGSTGTAGMGEAGSTAMETPRPCISSADEVVFIGDSYVNYINNLEPRVSGLARDEGVLMGIEGYRDVAVAGTSLSTGQIPSQWEGVKNDGIKYVVMDGGGNDVLILNPQCLGAGSDQDSGCQAVVENSRGLLAEMWASMKASGVSDVLMFFYPHIPNNNGQAINDYAIPIMQSECEKASGDGFRCHFLDTRPLFEGKGFIGLDGIHPNAAGADALAAELWRLMKEYCMGQKMGCCM